MIRGTQIGRTSRIRDAARISGIEYVYSAQGGRIGPHVAARKQSSAVNDARGRGMLVAPEDKGRVGRV